MKSQKVTFTNVNGYKLSARLELPADQHPHTYALFAHVFTGNKSLIATRHISRALTLDGIAVLRFDFTGLGESEGDFADTNFTSNVEDLMAAAQFLEERAFPWRGCGYFCSFQASIYSGNCDDWNPFRTRTCQPSFRR
jgi:alpha/beta superfamily hydrolase